SNDFDVDLLMPDARLSLHQGALALYNGGPFKARHRERLLHNATAILGIDSTQPFVDVHERQRQAFWPRLGGRAGTFGGSLPPCRRVLESNSRDSVQSYLAQFMREITCPACHGTRLNPQARAVRLGGQVLGDLVSLSVAAAVDCVPQLAFNARERAIAEP